MQMRRRARSPAPASDDASDHEEHSAGDTFIKYAKEDQWSSSWRGFRETDPQTTVHVTEISARNPKTTRTEIAMRRGVEYVRGEGGVGVKLGDEYESSPLNSLRGVEVRGRPEEQQDFNGRSRSSGLNRSRNRTLTRCWLHQHSILVTVLILAATGCLNAPGVCGLPANDSQDFQKNIPAKLVWVAVNKSAELPCDATPLAGDAVKLVLWFKDATGIPIYSYDSRAGDSKPPMHSTIATDQGQRMSFILDAKSPKEAHLQIKGVKAIDGGIYRCRVDFFNSPTKNYRVNLSLVEPPEEPRIFDAQGKEVAGLAGPFREGADLFLSCQVSGGRPAPKVTWWHDNLEIASQSHPSADKAAPAIVNQLFIGTVTREFLGTRLQCRAQGSKLVPAVVKEVTVQVHLKPLKVKIVTPNDLLTAGHPVPLRCDAWGSYPPAKIQWLLDGEPIRNADVTATTTGSHADGGNLTTSILTLKVVAENDGAEVTCRATNPWFSTGALEDKRVINVAYPPTVSVHLANEEPIRLVTRSEGENVTLKCRADARPPVSSYGWFKNGMRMSGESIEVLHLVGVERESAGTYACSALNTEGETRSSHLSLRVQYSPRCKPGTEQTSIGAINMHSLNVKCEVDADPPDSIKFSWTYNNTRNVSPVLNSRVVTNGLVSTITFLPQTDSEMVSLACWASNEVGRQSQPCLIHILPAKTPEPPTSCQLQNDTALEVVCLAGSDGGLMQHFLLEVINSGPVSPPPTPLQPASPTYPMSIDGSASTGDLDGGVQKTVVFDMENNNELSTLNDQATAAVSGPLYTLEEQQPHFKLPVLDPMREYQLNIYSVNAKGRSDAVILDRIRVQRPIMIYGPSVEDPKPAETSTREEKERKSTLVIVAGVIAAGFVIVTSIIVAGIVAICEHRRPKPPEPQEVRKRMRPARTDVPSMYAEEDAFEEEFTRSADIRQSRASLTRGSRYYTEGFVQYSQPSLNDPDLILPRCEIEFTPVMVTGPMVGPPGSIVSGGCLIATSGGMGVGGGGGGPIVGASLNHHDVKIN